VEATRQRIGRAVFLRRSSALVIAASGVGAFAPAAFADAPTPGDLAYLRLLIAAELLAVDFYEQAAVSLRILADEKEHYTLLAALMTAAGQTPTTADDIDFSYPTGTFASRRSVLRFAKELERMLAGAYIDALEHVETPGYRLTMGRIVANEAQHHSAIAALQGEPPIQRSFPTAVRIDAMSNYLDRYES